MANSSQGNTGGSSQSRNREVANRQRALEPAPPSRNFTLAGAEGAHRGMGGERVDCVISSHCRTQIFEFPGMQLRSDEDKVHHILLDTPPVQACVVSDLSDYFLTETTSPHYSISPCLRHDVAETNLKYSSKQGDSIPLFLVVEEFNQLTFVTMVKGECSLLPEVLGEGEKKKPMLVGGREGEKFIVASLTLDGAWPEVPNNLRLVNSVLAGVRAGQRRSGTIRRYVDSDCFITEDGRFVVGMQLKMSARPTVTTTEESKGFAARMAELTKAIAAMQMDMGIPHIALLVNAMYMDEYRDDPYLRFQFLQLWQSLSEAGPRHLAYQGDIRNDQVILDGKSTLLELKDYRDDIAHYWTETIDEGLLSDLQSTVNELVRRRYF